MSNTDNQQQVSPENFIGDKAKYDNHGQLIWGVKGNEMQRILDLRGWGAIQQLFNTEQAAGRFQDQLGEWIADAINQKLQHSRQSQSALSTEGKARSAGVELIAEERQRQINVEGWTPEHDAEHKTMEMSAAAACYIAHNISKVLENIRHTNQSPLAEFKVYFEAELDFFVNSGDRGDRSLAKAGWRNGWPWDIKWWKPSTDPIKNLIKAGALIAAEIDRLQGATPAPQPSTVQQEVLCPKCGCNKHTKDFINGADKAPKLECINCHLKFEL